MSKEQTTNYATVSYDSAYSADLQKLCQKLGIKKKDFLEKSISFFQKSGLDPREPHDVSSQIKPIENRLIGFLKVQDKNELQHFEFLQRELDDLKEQQKTTNGQIQNLIDLMIKSNS
jgi:hypothetical protein